MNWLPRLQSRLRALFRKDHLDARMDDEMRSHIEMQTRENLEAGMSPEEARRAALREFGQMDSIKETCREQRDNFITRHWSIVAQDLRHGIRNLRQNPGFTTVAVLTLTLGIGATTAIFSVAYAVALRPLPFPESERLVSLWTQTAQIDRLPMAAANHRDLQARNSVFEDIALLNGNANYNLTGDGEPERLLGARIAANLFPVLRVTPALGRGVLAEENQPGRDRVVILSHALWQRRFGSDPGVIGKTIRLENLPHTVIGVMRPEFQYPSREIQIWTPLTINPADFQTRTGFGHLAVARLKPEVTMEQARTEVSVISGRLALEYPALNRGLRLGMAPLRQDVAGIARKPLFVLLGAALGLLLIGACNLVNLLLARALTRGRETAVRTALGASQYRLIQQAAAELLPILALGGILGVLAARGGIKLAIPWLPAALPRVGEIAINLPVLLFSAGVLFLTAVLVLLLPASQAARVNLATTLREDTRTTSGAASQAGLRKLLVVGQLALTVMLLTGAGLLIRTFTALKQVDPGFRPQGVLTMRLAIPRSKYRGDDQVAAYCQRLLEKVRTLPGVVTAGLGNRLPFGGASGMSSVEFERSNGEPGTIFATDDTTITPGYFPTMGIPLLQGRSFTEQDTTNAPRVVIIDEQVARLAWPGENPIGKRMRSGPEHPWAEVVGMVRHIRHENLESDQRRQIYWNYLQRPRDRVTLVARAKGDARQLAQPALAAIRSVDPDQPAYAVSAMTEVLDQSLALRWFNTVTVSSFAGSSLLLALVGIYGVIAWSVRRRTRELGIRLALGAQRGSVMALVLGDGLKLAGAGIGLGLIGAVALARLLRGLLFGIGPIDPATFATVPLLLVAVALLACWLPARRAARVDPMVALRQD